MDSARNVTCICWPLPKMLANYCACNNSWVNEPPVAIHVCVFLLNRKCKVKKDDEAEVLAPLYDFVAVLPHIQAWRMHWRLWVGLIWSCGGSEWNFLWVYGLGWGLFVPKHFSIPYPIHSFIHSFFFINHNILTNVYIYSLLFSFSITYIKVKISHYWWENVSFVCIKIIPFYCQTTLVRLRTTGELWSVWFSTCIY